MADTVYAYLAELFAAEALVQAHLAGIGIFGINTGAAARRSGRAGRGRRLIEIQTLRALEQALLRQMPWDTALSVAERHSFLALLRKMGEPDRPVATNVRDVADTGEGPRRER